MKMIKTANIKNPAGINNNRIEAGLAYNAGINLVQLLKDDHGAKTKLTNLEMNLYKNYQSHSQTYSWVSGDIIGRSPNKVYGISYKVVNKKDLLHFINDDCVALRRTALNL